MVQLSHKADLANLYINPDHYNTDYNFYNYHKFKQTGCINIIYKTPSIFLNGLYFELPYCRILNIKKQAGATSFILSISINKDDILYQSQHKQTISQLLTKIDVYNTQFFTTHARKLEIRQSQTNKNNKHYVSGRQLTPSYSHDNKQSRFINPLIKKYTYQSFLKNGNINPGDASTNTIVINIEIKHVYLYKICELIKANQLLTDNPDTKLTVLCNTILDCINQEFFDFRANTMDINLEQDNIDLNIKFWTKANSFERTRTAIIMLWKVCGYQI